MWEIWHHLNGSLWKMSPFSLVILKKFCYVFSFWKFKICFGVDLFGFIQLEFSSASWICRFMHFAKLGELLAIISLTTFSASYFPFPSETNLHVLDLLFLLHESQRLCSFFFNLFHLCCSDWVNSIDLSSCSSPLYYWVHPGNFKTSWSLYFSVA